MRKKVPENKYQNLPSKNLSTGLSEGDEIDLLELTRAVWQGKLLVIIITMVFAASSVMYAVSLPDIYKSEALLSPNTQESSGGLGALSGQFGGLAALAGVSLSAGSSDKIAYTLEIIKSRQFIYEFIQQNHLKAPILAAYGWDRKTGDLIYNSDLFDVSTNKWVRGVKAPKQAEPSLFEAYQHFVKENLTVNQDKSSGMVTVSISHYSPILARQLVDKIVKAINQTIKQQDLAEAVKSIRYLEKELATTSVVNSQSMFYQLIEKQQQTIMLTKVRDDYVLKIVDPPVVAEEKSGPKRVLICILGTILGCAFAIFVVLVRYFRIRG